MLAKAQPLRWPRSHSSPLPLYAGYSAKWLAFIATPSSITQILSTGCGIRARCIQSAICTLAKTLRFRYNSPEKMLLLYSFAVSSALSISCLKKNYATASERWEKWNCSWNNLPSTIASRCHFVNHCSNS